MFACLIPHAYIGKLQFAVVYIPGNANVVFASGIPIAENLLH
jgi:hypothetical protein